MYMTESRGGSGRDCFEGVGRLLLLLGGSGRLDGDADI